MIRAALRLLLMLMLLVLLTDFLIPLSLGFMRSLCPCFRHDLRYL
jgi:hypothetical protein